MENEQRLSWLALNGIDTKFYNPCLCTWCRYSRWYGSCYDAENECQHPSEDIANNSSVSIELFGDCSGFEPAFYYDDAVEMLGMMLRGKYPDWSYARKLKTDQNEPAS